ncbi:MAG: hypothetical protein ABI183_23975 [Polyangiaceae bacterium]
MQQSSPPPQFQPSKQKSSNFIPIVLGVACVVFGSCGVLFAYAVYEAGTPEGKRVAKEDDEKRNAALDGFIAKWTAVRDGLPQTDSVATKCPAGTSTKLAPVVDSFFLESLLEDGRGDGGRIFRTSGEELNRDSLFSDSILDAELARAGQDAGPLVFANSFATSNIELLSKKPTVLVIDVDSFEAPKEDADGYAGGDLQGSLDVVDWLTNKTICNAPISAKSSDTISYGGGMQLTFHGIPSPTVGKTDVDEALSKDFKKNVEVALKASLAEMDVK